MNADRRVTIAVEGIGDLPIVRRLLHDHGFVIVAEHGLRGKSYIDGKLAAFNKAAQHGPWLVVRDLDHDAECAAALVAAKLPQPSAHMRFRVAVRAIETWLLADADGFSRYFSVAPHHVPAAPESLRDPKAAVLRAIERSRSRSIREDMLPAASATARVGPAYVGRVTQFAESAWNWKRAARRSDSLRRCISSLRALK